MQLDDVILYQLSDSTIETRGKEVMNSLYNIKISLSRRAFRKCVESTNHILRSGNHTISFKSKILIDQWHFSVISSN